jgi:hypothetical protein
MPFLNREPETPYAVGLLIVLGLIMIVAALRYLPFFLHEILGVQ